MGRLPCGIMTQTAGDLKGFFSTADLMIEFKICLFNVGKNSLLKKLTLMLFCDILLL